MTSKYTIKSLAKVNKGYDAWQLEVDDLFDDASKCQDVFSSASARAKTILIVPQLRLDVVSDPIEKKPVVQLGYDW